MKLEKLKKTEWQITSNLMFSFIIFYLFTKDYNLYTINSDLDKLNTILIIFLSVPFFQLFNKDKSTKFCYKFDTCIFLLWNFFINQKNDYFELSRYNMLILGMIFVPLIIKLAYNIITDSDEKNLFNEENFFSKIMWFMQFIGLNIVLTLKTLLDYNAKQILIIFAIILLINLIYFKYIKHEYEEKWQFFILASICYFIYIN